VGLREVGKAQRNGFNRLSGRLKHPIDAPRGLKRFRETGLRISRGVINPSLLRDRVSLSIWQMMIAARVTRALLPQELVPERLHPSNNVTTVSIITTGTECSGDLECGSRTTRMSLKAVSIARWSVSDYINTFYNRTRRHAHLGAVSPEPFETSAKCN
jgi:hypothetical protein